MSTFMDLQSRSGGPFRPTTQSSGEMPSIVPDVPLSIVFLVLYIVGGGFHMYLLLTNKKRGKKFLFNGMVFGLCNVRIFTFAVRTAWAVHPTNIRLGIASGIFVYAGTILLFIANLFFAQRIIRAQHQAFGWSKVFSAFVPAMTTIIVLTLLMIIVAVIQMFYTLRPRTRQIDRDIQLYALTTYAIMAFLPLPMVLISTLAGLHPRVKARRVHTPVDKFGDAGRLRHKIALVLASAVVLTLGAAFRAGTTWLHPVPARTPTGHMVAQPWYFTKAAFYCFNFVIELIIVYGWLIFRIDNWFNVPNGAKGSYGQRTVKTVDSESPTPAADDEEKNIGEQA